MIRIIRFYHKLIIPLNYSSPTSNAYQSRPFIMLKSHNILQSSTSINSTGATAAVGTFRNSYGNQTNYALRVSRHSNESNNLMMSMLNQGTNNGNNNNYNSNNPNPMADIYANHNHINNTNNNNFQNNLMATNPRRRYNSENVLNGPDDCAPVVEQQKCCVFIAPTRKQKFASRQQDVLMLNPAPDHRGFSNRKAIINDSPTSCTVITACTNVSPHNSTNNNATACVQQLHVSAV